MKFYDITLPISQATAVWPGQAEYQREETRTSAIVSKLTLSSHFATHVDAPRHFVFDADGKGKGIDQLPMSAMVGKFKVIEIKSREKLISLADLNKAAGKLKINSGDRILFKTANSKINRKPRFSADYVSLSLEAAQFLARKKIALVGIDYFGIEAKSAPGHPVHKILLSKNIVVVEGLDLSKVAPGIYSGAILPLKIEKGDGAPARAVLWK